MQEEKQQEEKSKPEEPTQEQVAAFIQEAIVELQKKVGDGARIIVMASRNGPGSWGYCWSIRGDSFGVLGLLGYSRKKIEEWLAAALK